MRTTQNLAQDDDIAVDVEPFVIDVPKDLLIDLVRRRILSTEALVAGMRGPVKKEADDEVKRLNAWLDTILLCQDEDISLAVVEEVALEALEEEQRAARPKTKQTKVPIC